jgi:hypothetical protein
METMKAFAIGQATQDQPLMVFDWEKAAKRIKETGCSVAGAGLRSDWDWTGGEIWRNGEPDRDSYTYLASTWAVPELELDGSIEECWRYIEQTPGWDHTPSGRPKQWPSSRNPHHEHHPARHPGPRRNRPR